MFKYELGLKVKDKITGMTGILTARANYLFGCNRYNIQPAAPKNGTAPEAWWVDEPQVVVIGLGVSKDLAKTGKPGGPMTHHP